MTLHSYAGATTQSDKWLRCNGWQLRKLAKAGLLWLEQNHQYVNSLNVFPVPDGDTGTNMLLTMRSAVARVADSEEDHVGKVAAELSQGALMGARGNSGVILSQIWRGLAKGLQDKELFDAVDLAEAFQLASDTAYNGVMRPVEGTILTVIREGAEEAGRAAKQSRDLRYVLERVVERCNQTLKRTPEMLPILKQAGVVDSGGQGLVYIFEGMLRYVSGQMVDVGDLDSQYAIEMVRQESAQSRVAPENGRIENPYDVQFILMGEDLDVSAIRQRIDAMGDSTVVVGDERTVKVHIHVENPGEPLAYGSSLGAITDVVVENMQLQMEEILHDSPAPPVLTSTGPAHLAEQIGVVAVAAGEGLAEIFRSLGVGGIVHGGQTNNPSTEEIMQAIRELPNERVILLPNNKNIFLAAEAAAEMCEKKVVVVPTRSAPQGFGALLCFNPAGDLQQVADGMVEATGQVTTGELTRATRSVTIDDVTVEEGEVIGLVDGRLAAAGTDLSQVLPELLLAMDMDEREIISVYAGADVNDEEAAGVVSDIELLYPHVEVELLPGGQAHYFFIFGAE